MARWMTLPAVALAWFLAAPSALAVCPVCTVAVAAGVELSRWYGVDDTIAGLWIGGFTVSLIWWTVGWLDRKGVRFFGRKPLIVVGYYLLVVAPFFWWGDVVVAPLWGLNRLLLGTVVGSFAFFAGALWYADIKRRHGGHAQFPFQKVVLPIAPLLLLSLFFFFLTR